MADERPAPPPRVIGESVLSSFPMVAMDTSPEAAALQLQAYREMGPAGRLQIAFELSDLVHAMAVAGIRRRHPELSEADARTMLAERLYRVKAPRP